MIRTKNSRQIVTRIDRRRGLQLRAGGNASIVCRCSTVDLVILQCSRPALACVSAENRIKLLRLLNRSFFCRLPQDCLYRRYMPGSRSADVLSILKSFLQRKVTVPQSVDKGGYVNFWGKNGIQSNSQGSEKSKWLPIASLFGCRHPVFWPQYNCTDFFSHVCLPSDEMEI